MIKNLFLEAQRRRVWSVIASYAIAGWVAVQVLSIIPQAIGLPDSILTLSTVLYLAFFPVVIFFSWYFDITSEGIKRTPNKGETEPAKVGKLYWFGFAGMVVLSSILGFYGYQHAISQIGNNAELVKRENLSQSIAVLPFRDASSNSDQLFLGLGLQEEISNKLSTFAGLKVASTYSSTAYAAKYTDLSVIASKLGVATILTGSSRVSGDRLRVRVELIVGATLEVIWSQSFTRELVDFFSIEEEISRAVVNLLQEKVISDDDFIIASKTENSLALTLYLQGREKLRLRTSEDILEARKLFEQSLALDSEYANARVGLAQTFLLSASGHNSLGNLDPELAAQLAKENIDVVLSRFPELPEAHASLGRVLAYRGEHEQALTHYQQAISLSPNYATAYVWQYFSLEALQRSEQAFASLEKAYALDPAYLLVIYNYALAQQELGNLTDAERLYNEILELHEESPLSHRGFAALAFSQGDLPKAAIEYKNALTKSPKSESYRTALLSILFQVGAVDIAKSYLVNKEWDVNVLIAEEKYDQVHALMEQKLILSENNKWLVYEAAWYQYLYGDMNAGSQLLLENNSQFSEQEMFLPPLCNPAMEFAYAYQLNDDLAKATNLLQGCRDLLANAETAGKKSEAQDYLAARIAALSGQPSMAIDRLQNAFDKGWREHWSKNDPLLVSIRDDKQVQEIFSQIDDELNKAKTAIEDNFAQ
ncbi:tetratricopeptide repeat protein [Glaciecola sp. XM2]|jgi:TolB-like protein/Tfp pilus assembly protein PilF|uniref:tetratricopeptide repeat protein n=1 Tax=Glaciecola sp. XM2 TaxID=1914931 RepID=UPI001BDF241C|nr:tetratricopeptide repeat protein [Glaciecola sp. XM2]MBT1450099.1 tetratricopeptide repeat protein [Glaciecola sp. XM2]